MPKVPPRNISELAKAFSSTCQEIAMKNGAKVVVSMAVISLVMPMMVPEKKWASYFY